MKNKIIKNFFFLKNLSLLKLINLNFILNKKTIIFWTILFFIFSAIMIFLCLVGCGNRTIAFQTIFDEHSQYPWDHLSFSDAINIGVFGYIETIFITIMVASLSKKNISKQIDTGNIFFWLLKPVKKSKIIISKALFIYTITFFIWFINFIIFAAFMTEAKNDMENYKFAVLQMINYLVLMILLETIIIFLNLILSNHDEWFNIIIWFFVIYLGLCFYNYFQWNTKIVNLLDFHNLIGNTLYFNREVVWKTIVLDSDAAGMTSQNIFEHVKINLWHFFIGYILSIWAIVLINYLLFIKFIKLEFNI
ncbi:hypothetical protein [Spiroplasma endosymbiont of Crioceris asparagi]|uniref:hypothetical protein n=1 Tax=Spiroplasma endosymbiont of Crioceris asparagi TaxID=3066286 RepID=UPI0030CF4DB9